MARAIREKLIDLRPERQQAFADRYASFHQRLGAALVGDALAKKYDVEKLALLFEAGELGDFLKSQGDESLLGGWFGLMLPYRGTRVVGDHNLWPYFARRFGISVIGFIDEVIVKTTGLCLGYGRRIVLEHVDMQIHAGKFWFFLGPNGKGKTTLLRAILGRVRPQTGQLWVHPELAQRERIGFVPQRCDINPTLPTTVREFVLLGLVGILLALVGVLVVARDQIFIGAAVSQASTLGIALALGLGSWAATEAREWLHADAFLSAMAVAASHRRVLLFALDPAMAAAVGIRLKPWALVTSVWLGLAVGLSIRSAGMLYTFGCLVLPALVAKNLCREVRPMFVVAPLVAVSTGAAGSRSVWDSPGPQVWRRGRRPIPTERKEEATIRQGRAAGAAEP